MTDEEKAEILKSTEKLWNERNRLKELEEENAELQTKLNDSNELCNKQAMRIAELEAQIEKMGV